MADLRGFWPQSQRTEADKYLAASENMLLVAEKQEEDTLRKLTGQPVALDLRVPRNILRRIVAKPFQFDEAAPFIADYAAEFSNATGFDHSGAIVAATTAAAAVIDDRYLLEVRPQSNWTVPARQWAFLCTDPSGGKSPILRPATDPVKRIHYELHASWQTQNRGLADSERTPMPSLYTGDATIPALSERLKDNPRGIFMLNEEFSSWIGSIDTADRGEAMKNRGDWLQLRDGGIRQIDRVGRGSILVPNWGASVLAACTPDGLRSQLKSTPEDGLIQRFVPCLMQSPNLDADGDCTKAIERWDQALRWAFEFTTRPTPQICVRFSPEAAEYFEIERKEIRRLALSTGEFASSYAAHLGKHPGMLAEIALTFHVLWGQGTPSSVLSLKTLETAAKYMRRVRQHAFALYSSVLGSTPAFELARSLARSMVASDECTTRINRDWMLSHCAPFRKAEDRIKREAVQILEDADWIEATPGLRAYGGWPRSFTVNSRIFSLYAREGEEWRARRAAVKDAISGIDDDEADLA